MKATSTSGPGRTGGTAGALSLKSERFRRLWARHDVRTARPGVFSIRHPRVGDLELMVEKFAVTGTDGLEVLLLHAEPGSRSARALEMLGERPLA